jgi:hypothetical protein
MHRLALLVGIGWLGGCASSETATPWVSRRGDLSLAAAPAIMETYVIEGSVRSAGPMGEPVANAIVCAFSDGRFHARSNSDRQGRFRISGDAGRAAPIVEVGSNVRSAETAPLPPPKVVEHSFASLRAHPHYLLDILVQHPDYAPSRAELEVPRDTRAPPMEFLLANKPPHAALPLNENCEQAELAGEAD